MLYVINTLEIADILAVEREKEGETESEVFTNLYEKIL
jgi:hypothetical protein